MRKYLNRLLLLAMVLISLCACKKQSEEEKNPTNVDTSSSTLENNVDPSGTEETTNVSESILATTDEADQSALNEVEYASFSAERIIHSGLDISMIYPEEALVTEDEDELTMETSDYLLYVFGTDTYNGGCLNLSDVITALSVADQSEIAKDILRLKDYTMSQDVKADIYNDINGMRGFFCPFSSVEYISDFGTVFKGNGFVMAYEKTKEAGVYVVLGIQNDQVSSDKDMRHKLEKCARSLTKIQDTQEYKLWAEEMPDGVKAKALFKENAITEVIPEEKGFCLFFDEEKNGSFLIQHFNVMGHSSSEKYLQSIIDDLAESGAMFSEIEEVRGKMTYRKSTMSYSNEGHDVKEIICVSVNENGSTWLVDLYGTAEEVEAQKENLVILLWSLQED